VSGKPGDPEGIGHDVESASPADQEWNRDYETWRRTRLDRVQASARVWLGLLTTLLGLLGSVVLFKGGDLVTGVTASGTFQVFMIVLIVLIFAGVVLAMIAGGAATWGGLRHPAPLGDVGTDAIAQLATTWRRFFFSVFVFLALPPGDRSPDSGRSPWERYKEDYENTAERSLTYLRASRKLGVGAAALIAVLASVAVIAGTVSPAPTEVIVVHHGRITCGPVSDDAKYSGITQAIPVGNC
jgi:hypothetical protein